MAQEVEFGNGGEGKIRSFWVGTGLVIIDGRKHIVYI